MANINQEIDTIRVGGTDYEVSDPHALYGEHDESAPDLVDVPLYESDLVTQVTDDPTKPSAANVPYELKQQIDQVSSELPNYALHSFTAIISGNSDVNASFTEPNAKAIIPVGCIPANTWDTHAEIINVDMTNSTFSIHTFGTTQQEYTIKYWVIT